ncbi:bifunctional tetrahydrofolate synthase/dihydrofolate synthase [Rickettsiella endosymbiont of Dermanyssus gallinae]|uniref:bifunctional tetrahydrofolate synthase/dihydrofolate synthase n=1 Tax=Rickettsiella endosymbiont of Dermanyssus gallinae TaxID=2856608 RepID=UPI001C52B935|nr:bifunctional tetrahydrofolate synthase/dihydrofolate synthase [Rickettsiella endosymbiont of Dermanyssus gallinae]
MNKVLAPHLGTKEDWLNYLETAHPITIDLGLERIKIVAARLEVLDFDCPVITVAGTNGKGSCVALTQAVLAAAGYRVGTYTSPHLLDYNERIQIAGEPVSDSALCEAFNCIDKARAAVSLTYFEFGTLAALLLFKQAQLDAIILEVGLGGRLDAVNCVDADISVISMVDLDHMEWLGDTRELIAKEKAGIMRPNKPCVMGDFSLPAAVYEHAVLENVFLYNQGQQFDYKKQISSWSWQSQRQTLSDLPLPKIDLQNAATVLQVIELLSKQLSIRLEAIEEGLKQVFIPGRFQVVEQGCLQFILDVAHNPAGGRCLAKRLAQEACAGKTHAVVGMLVDKDISNTLAPLTAQIDQFYLADLDVARGATAVQLNQHLMRLNTKAPARTFSSPVIAVQEACKVASKGDRVLIFGSFHTVGLVYPV